MLILVCIRTEKKRKTKTNREYIIIIEKKEFFFMRIHNRSNSTVRYLVGCISYVLRSYLYFCIFHSFLFFLLYSMHVNVFCSSYSKCPACHNTACANAMCSPFCARIFCQSTKEHISERMKNVNENMQAKQKLRIIERQCEALKEWSDWAIFFITLDIVCIYLPRTQLCINNDANKFCIGLQSKFIFLVVLFVYVIWESKITEIQTC